MIVVLVAAVVALAVFGVLYIKDHLADEPPTESVGIPGTTPPGVSDNPGTTASPGTSDSPVVPEKVTIVLDAGHGGVQPGCVINNVCEKDITLSVVMLLKEKLEAKGFAVVLTREDDEDISLSRRSEIANNAGAKCFISIHCNSFVDDQSVSGFECYYYQSAESKTLAEIITSSADSHQIETRRVKEENYAVLRNTMVPAVLIEIGFMTNPEEQEALISPEYQALLADAIVDGVLK